MSTITQTPSPVKTRTENEAAFARIQQLAADSLAEARAAHRHWSLSFEDHLNVYIQTWAAAGYDFSGMWPTDSFDAWVAQHEDDFAAAYTQQFDGINRF